MPSQKLPHERHQIEVKQFLLDRLGGGVLKRLLDLGDDQLRATLRRHWDEDGIVELTGLIAFQNLSSKFNAALDVPPQGFCVMPKTA